MSCFSCFRAQSSELGTAANGKTGAAHQLGTPTQPATSDPSAENGTFLNELPNLPASDAIISKPQPQKQQPPTNIIPPSPFISSTIPLHKGSQYATPDSPGKGPKPSFRDQHSLAQRLYTTLSNAPSITSPRKGLSRMNRSIAGGPSFRARSFRHGPTNQSSYCLADFESCYSSFTSVRTADASHIQPGTPKLGMHASHNQVLLESPRRVAQPQVSSPTKSHSIHTIAAVHEAHPELEYTWAVGTPHMEFLGSVARCYHKSAGVHHTQNQHNPCETVKIIMSHCEDNNIPVTDLIKAAATIPDEQVQFDLTRLLNTAKNIQIAEREVNNDSRWQTIRDDELKLMYRNVAGTTQHWFKGRCIVDTPVDRVVAVAREVDYLCNNSEHKVASADILDEYSAAEVMLCIIIWMPWPLPNLTFVIEAVGIDCLNRSGGFLIDFSTPPGGDKHELISHMPMAKNSNYFFRVLPGSCIFLEPLPPLEPGGQPRCRATLEARTDPGTKLPTMVVTFILKVLGPLIFTLVNKLVNNPNRGIFTRVPLRPQFYAMIQRRAAEHLALNEKGGVPPVPEGEALQHATIV